MTDRTDVEIAIELNGLAENTNQFLGETRYVRLLREAADRLCKTASTHDARISDLEVENAMLREKLRASIAVIEDYLEYKHDGDPWSEDPRLMGEMAINHFGADGGLKSARDALLKATGGQSNG